MVLGAARALVIGFRRWRAWNLAPLLRAEFGQVVFVRNVAAVQALRPCRQDRVLVWGAAAPPGLDRLLDESGAALVRIEDGFIRSVGLGSDLIVPRSLVFDECGIYFDATRPSGLERVLATADFNPVLCGHAAALRDLIVTRALTKYNVEADTPAQWVSGGRPVVLVPGQVESDASIALGAGAVRTNHDLLAAVRAARPGAFIVYKPHPDVMSGNRRGRLAENAAMQIADHVETRASIVACLAQSDELHTMTSLAGFDALLRGVPVVTHGAPFYAGWGLTCDLAHDHPAWARRGRRLTLDALTAGAMLLYPRYWDPVSGCMVPAQDALLAIASERDAIRAGPDPHRLMHGFWRRQGRKVRVLARAWSRA